MADQCSCDVRDCPQFNEYAAVCRLAQYPAADYRFRIPDRCQHRKFKHALKNEGSPNV